MDNKEFAEAFDYLDDHGSLLTKELSQIDSVTTYRLCEHDIEIIKGSGDSKKDIIDIAADIKKYLATGEF
ncbi:MAG: hypothetical protein BMS9Abin31_0142 [Gammaproteobacteria bacterium]|nr:MAG: hypothetical protein BMS9Abin31_0142 [Gammaproteobacteria bacterium]